MPITFKEVIEDMRSSISIVVENTFKETNFAREKMMVDAKGDRVARDILSTQIDDVCKQVMKHGKPKSKTRLPEHLELPFYQNHNIFVRPEKTGRTSNRIMTDVITHDAHVDKNSKNVKSRGDENRAEYFRREFRNCFLDSIREGAFEKPMYYQTFFDLAHRERIQQVQVNLLSKQDTQNAIEDIIRQIQTRNKNISKFFDTKSPLLNFQFRDENEDLLLTYEGDKSENLSPNAINIDTATISEIRQLVEKQLAKITESLTNVFVEEEMLFDHRMDKVIAPLSKV